jgi:cobalt-zinc-cadmium efflux system outer membrane protein
MTMRRLLMFAASLCLGGCLYHAQERADQTVCDLAIQPYDQAPSLPPAKETMPPADKSSAKPLQEDGAAKKEPSNLTVIPTDIQTMAYLQEKGDVAERARIAQRLKVPEEIPGSESPALSFPKDEEGRRREVRRLYPKLPDLPIEPKASPGPEGKPYTLGVLQRLAAENSPQLRQAAHDVEAARGALIQAKTYPNPSVGMEVDPSNDGSTAGVRGVFWDQPIKTGGKLKLLAAAAEKDLENAELALRRSRSDLATQMRTTYFAFLAAKETMRVSKALARFTDEVYNVQAELTEKGFGAGYEPATLRAQAVTTRLTYQQAIATYIYSWKQLVAAIGLRQLALSEVEGRLDVFIPYYEYDRILDHVVHYHTDVLTARNSIDKARFNLKLAQVTPVYPDVDVRVAVLKEFALPPFQWVHTAQIGFPLPIWDQNKGNIIAAEAALGRAREEPHRAELTLTNSLATAYTAYQNNLQALESYRRYVLPDQVRAFRGVYARRTVDPNVAFADLVTAQQNLSSNVTTYLSILGQVWSSVVTVADFLQTDDLYQLAKPKEVPPLPDLEHFPSWACRHECPVGSPASGGKSCLPAAGCQGAKSIKSEPTALTVPAPDAGPSHPNFQEKPLSHARVKTKWATDYRSNPRAPENDLVLEEPPEVPKPPLKK